MITEHQYLASAELLKCEPAAVKAVAEVESGGAGIISGRPVILFEPHIFWKQLKRIDKEPLEIQYKWEPIMHEGKDTGQRRRVLNPEFADILYPVWGTMPYAKGQDAQHEKLQRAEKINREAALQSASWGKFQIMGFNYPLCKCANIQTFVNAMFKSEDEHLRLFTNYILTSGLSDELRYKDWKGFARGYNGPLYARNNYDKKLEAAFKKFKK